MALSLLLLLLFWLLPGAVGAQPEATTDLDRSAAETKLDRVRASAVVFHGNTLENTMQKRKKILKQGIFSRKN